MGSKRCNICPRTCNIDRGTSRGACKEGTTLRLARAALHFWEEPLISGESGSGTVFFSGCPLGCIYCQNRSIASGEVGKEVSIERLAKIFLELQEQGALNINLVTPTHFLGQIKEALDLVRSPMFSDHPLKLPIVYNTSGYEKPEVIESLAGYVDIFLTDFKYFDPELAQRFSHAVDYPEVASKALDSMFHVAGDCVFDITKNGEEFLQKGVIVRHMLLPGYTEDSKQVLDLLGSKSYASKIMVSVMNQYTPMKDLDPCYPELIDKVSDYEYDEVIKYASALDFLECFIQEGGSAEESFIPSFDYEGV